jgi:isoleucyl-tRNA synthetase
VVTEYKQTLNLPQTSFEMRANLARKEPALLQLWQDTDLYGRIRAARAGSVPFVLHDGPPYANGQLHHGHILNKILKDIILKDRTMAGQDAPYVPGWDCHGLPIEVQVDKELGSKKASMDKAAVHAACREYAGRFVDSQRSAFMRLGVLGRWAAPYLTMAPAYEAATLEAFAGLLRQGLVYKGLRPVHWCTVHQTALAEAEVEYDAHTSPSAYVSFAAVAQQPSTAAVAPDHARLDNVPDLPAVFDFVVWTTTPWTLPANVAIALHPDLDYVAYPVAGRLCLVAQERLAAFLAAIGAPPVEPAAVQGPWPGRAFAGQRYAHAFLPRHGQVVLGAHVTTDAGTGCVHTAPGHGADDFDMARKFGLEVLSPVDAAGVLTAAAGPYAGLTTRAANAAILADLAAAGSLLSDPEATVSHRFAHCWRCHKPTITRATEQWWVAMDRLYAGGPSLRQRALASIEAVRWVPAWGIERIRGMLAGRPDWCLSRQRTWGVPIAVVYCTQCDHPHADADAVQGVAKIFAEHGASVWFERSVEELFGALRCRACGGSHFRKETDILDVWFDSGVSYAAVLAAQGLGHLQGAPADLYLEGSDQHRGWFHSSLLCSLATDEQAPYKAVLTHGFVVDGAGKKISKSKGNFIDPFKAINKDGAEIMRLWVASEDYRDDIRLSQEILTRLADTYRKVRNTIRYLLGNLADFDPAKDTVAPTAMHAVDRYAVALGLQAGARARAAYSSYTFHTVMQTLVELCTVDLSAFYLDMLKDRMYASLATGPGRRSAQTALYILARDLLRLMAPVFCFTAEEAWQVLPRFADDPDSVHLALYPGESVAGLAADPPQLMAVRQAVALEQPVLLQQFGEVRDVRRVANAALEQARRDKIIGASSAAELTFFGGTAALAPLMRHSVSLWADMLIVSAVNIAPKESGPLQVTVGQASGEKCARCWLFRTEVGQHAEHPQLCARCLENF